MFKDWEDKGAFLIPAFVTFVLIASIVFQSSDRSSLEVWIRVLSALLTPLIAFIALYIAYQQALTARLKLKLDLFEKRYEIYEAQKDFVYLVISKIALDQQELFKFIQETKTSYFLFGDEIYNYLDKIYKQAVTLRYVNQKASGTIQPEAEEYTKLIEKEHELLVWFTEQPEIAKNIFSKYLRLNFD